MNPCGAGGSACLGRPNGLPHGPAPLESPCLNSY